MISGDHTNHHHTISAPSPGSGDVRLVRPVTTPPSLGPAGEPIGASPKPSRHNTLETTQPDVQQPSQHRPQAASPMPSRSNTLENVPENAQPRLQPSLQQRHEPASSKPPSRSNTLENAQANIQPPPQQRHAPASPKLSQPNIQPSLQQHEPTHAYQIRSTVSEQGHQPLGRTSRPTELRNGVANFTIQPSEREAALRYYGTYHGAPVASFPEEHEVRSEDSHIKPPQTPPKPQGAPHDMVVRPQHSLPHLPPPTTPRPGQDRAPGFKFFQRNKKEKPKDGESVEHGALGQAMAKIQELHKTISSMDERYMMEIRDIHNDHQQELQRQKDQYTSTKQLLDDRSKELVVAQQFLTTADSLAEADVIRMVKGMNEEILQTAALLGETGNLPDTPRLKPEAGFDETLASQAELPNISKTILKFLHESRRIPDPSLALQIAVQAYLASSCEQIVSVWHQGQGADAAFKEVYNSVRQTMSPSIAGRWRAMTRSNLDRMRGEGQDAIITSLHDGMISGISTLVAYAGYHSELPPDTTIEWINNVRSIILASLTLRNAIGEKISSRDLELIAHPLGTPFDPKTMVNGFDDGRKPSRKSVQEVLCTTDLGLRSWKGVVKEYGTEYMSEILLKPKIALRSIAREALGISL